jgi:putative component of membrane protein insertase Oxa1/YidC/SpoIIIJ protein YidD
MSLTSQQFILIPLLHGFNNSSVSSAVPYSCLLFSMCSAYAEIGLLVLM